MPSHDYILLKLSSMNYTVDSKKEINSLIFDIFSYWRNVWKVVIWGAYQRLNTFHNDDYYCFNKLILNAEEKFEFLLSRKMKKCNNYKEIQHIKNKLWSSNNDLYQIIKFYANYLIEYNGLINKPYLDFLYSEPEEDPLIKPMEELIIKQNEEDQYLFLYVPTLTIELHDMHVEYSKLLDNLKV